MDARQKEAEEELDFITTCIDKILHQKKLNYLEICYIHLMLNQKMKYIEAEVESYKKRGI